MLGRVATLVVLVVGLLATVVVGQVQPPTKESATPARPLGQADPRPWGRTVHYIEVRPASKRDQVLSRLKTEKGKPLLKEQVKEDLVQLYRILRLRADILYREIGTDRVELVVEILPSDSFDRTVFTGNEKITESEIWALTGLREHQLISEADAERAVLLLRDRYLQEGYYYVHVSKDVEIAERDGYVERTLKVLVDEGPQVQVRRLRFRGNTSFPGNVTLGYGVNLRGDSNLTAVPGVFDGSPYSEWKVEDDIQRVELFYRRKGFLNARVHLEERTISKDREWVDLTYRVHEGERFKVTAVDIDVRRSNLPDDSRPPLYPKEILLEQLDLKAGEFYDAAIVNRDRRELERFYGERGHPTMRNYGLGPRQRFGSLFEVFEPWLTYALDKPEVKVTYRLVEGEPKKLREVRIHGNSITRDRVIRRNIKLMPGEALDVTKMDRSRYLLDRTRYFVDRTNLSGVRFQLTPVEGADEEVDLDVFVKEGETGNFLWGAGISSGTGVRATVQFNKRNFDITRLPSSWNPGTWFTEIADGKAFHGGGQTLDLLLAPGTEYSFFRVSWIEPDIFQEHIDTIGLRTDVYRTIRILDSFNTDKLGAAVTLSRIFDETSTVSLTVRDELVEIEDVDGNAPLLVWDNIGESEIRALRVGANLSDLDNPLHPRKGYNVEGFAEIAGGPIGGDEDFYKLGFLAELYRPFFTDSFERKHVVYAKVGVNYADTYGNTKDVYPSERFYMGGSNLRGFDQRRAGPVQFGAPTGGTSMLLSTLEYQFPLVSTQMQGTTFHTEIIRGVLFSDFGLLGLDYDDSSFREPRLTIGFGVRIQVPVLQVPIQLDLGWPVLSQITDREEQLFFSFRHF